MWERERQREAAVLDCGGGRWREGLELAGSPEGSNLRGRWLLGRAHGFPGGIGVAVGVVYAEMLKVDAADIGGKAIDAENDGDRGCWEIVVLVVPEEDGGGVLVSGGEGIDIGGLAYARGE